ncbi:AEC family transporter [Shouchella lehensis]|uniref:AEC family transporter n=1 Tax=Shouchella lehensis TaxID=300825 RepID=A0A4Y7WMS3_9BACI|nr:AEC family transporter [Shouchella lehensis]MBG9782978.1 transporter [Shouchella lehensis]TES49667.1 AEC family transporter [Shouchella lehensis]
MFGAIFLEVIFPILVLMALGLLLQRQYEFKLKPFSTLLTVCFMPASIFLNLYYVDIDLIVLSQILGYLLLFTLVMILFSTAITKILHLSGSEAAVLKNSVSLMNSGNYGLPVSQMIFSANPLGVTIQIFVLIFQNLLTYSYGLYNLLSATKSFKGILLSFLKMPIIHALILGLLFQLFRIPLPSFIETPLSYLASGFIALALILLGAQLATIQFGLFHRVVLFSIIGRLLVGPSVALGIIVLLNLDGIVAQSLFIASSFPTSRNTATLALQYNIEPELHAQVVLYTTLFSCLTVTGVIALSTVLF